MIPRDDLIEISPDVFSGNSHKKSLGVGKRRKRRKRGIIIDVSNGVTNNTMVGSNSTVEFANPDWHRR